MGKIVLLLPTEDMRMTAHNFCQQHTEYPVTDIRTISTENSVTEARIARAGGADIIVARGMQAMLIRKYTDIPVVHIVLTAQEMAILVTKARQIVAKPYPVVAIVGFRNMLCDMSYFNELYNVDLRTFYTESEKDVNNAVRDAVEDGADVLIGGEMAVKVATRYNIPSLFLATTEDSLRQALETAKNLDYAMAVEKKNAAEMETLLDYSYSGVVRLDQDGVIRNVNAALEQMVDVDGTSLIGRGACDAIPEINAELMDKVLREGREDAVILEWNHVALYTILAPIVYDDSVDGAILTFHRTQKNSPHKKQKDEISSLAPLTSFDDISQKSKTMKACMDTARLYALSEQPVVLLGEAGTEKRMIAQAMHTAGDHRNGPFLDVSCAGLNDEQQMNILFGDKGAVMQTQGGTLLIQDLDALTIANQYRLYQLIRFHVIHGTDIAQLRQVDVRVMVTSSQPLKELADSGAMRQDLYYLLAGLELQIPPLRERKEDLEYHLDRTLKDLFRKYGRYHVLTEGARKYLLSYSWPGNLFQLERFCERQILTTRKRSIDEIAVSNLMRQIYGDPADELPDLAYEERKDEILKALKQTHGSRERTAELLGISTTTLWRQMKKYGVEAH